MQTKKDPYTGEIFIPKRRNQRFATSQNRIAYNNEKAANFRKKMVFYESQLRSNFRILDSLMDSEEQMRVHKEFLLGKGYQFGLSTHVVKYEGDIHFATCNFILISKHEHIEIIRYE